MMSSFSSQVDANLFTGLQGDPRKSEQEDTV